MKRKRIRASIEIVERLLELGRLAYGSLPAEPGLTRTQWAALHYFARANNYSRTASAFGSFHATTPGTVSETISNLVRRGLLTRCRSTSDRRNVYLDLTERGWEVLRNDPSGTLDRAVEELPAGQATMLADALTRLTAKVAGEQRRPLFGVCRRCKYFEVDRTSVVDTPREGCRLLNVLLDSEDAAALCVGFEQQ